MDKMNKLPQEYIVTDITGAECTEIWDKYYSKKYAPTYHWRYMICSPKLQDWIAQIDIRTDRLSVIWDHLPQFTYSQWKEMYYNKEEFVLPEKWCIESTNEADPTLIKWRGGNYTSRPAYLCSNKMWVHKRFTYGYTEITYEQFKKYVLKEEEIKTYTLEELVNNKTVVVYLDNVNEWNALRGTELFNMCDYNGRHCYCLVDGTFSSSSSKTDLGAYGKSGYESYNTIIQFNQINFNKKENTMKQEFSIEGSVALKTAFVQEAGLTTYTKNTITGTYLVPEGRLNQVQSSANTRAAHFRLPAQYAEALAYVKDYYTPEAKKMYFGDTEFTVYKTYADCSSGRITKAEVKKVVDWLDTKITILGYDMNLAVSEKNFIQFGCISGTAEQAKAILAEMK